MVLAISNDVLRLATERIRSAWDDMGAASSDKRRAAVENSIQIVVSSRCGCGRVLLWVRESWVRVCSSCVFQRKRERRAEAVRGDTCIMRRWPAGLGGGRRARLTSSLEVKESSKRVPDTRFEELPNPQADLHCPSSPRTRIGFVELLQSLREFRGLQAYRYTHTGSRDRCVQ